MFTTLLPPELMRPVSYFDLCRQSASRGQALAVLKILVASSFDKRSYSKHNVSSQLRTDRLSPPGLVSLSAEILQQRSVSGQCSQCETLTVR